jgi:hypothetical protein
VVVYCVHGHEVSQTAAASLANAGIDAAYLAGGIARWRDEQLPTRRKSQETTNKWVTRERPKIDRIACPWLIRRFINPQGEFLYVPTDKVVSVAAELKAIPYDIEGVTFAHEGERCSFDTILRIFGISDPRSTGWRRLCGAPTRRAMIWRRNAAACLRSRSASRRTFPTTTRCCGTAW